MRILLAIFSGLFLAACDGSSLTRAIDSIDDDDARAVSDTITDLVLQEDAAGLRQLLAPEIDSEQSARQLEQMMLILPDSEPDSIDVVGYNFQFRTDSSGPAIKRYEFVTLLRYGEDDYGLELRLVQIDEADHRIEYIYVGQYEQAAYRWPDRLSLSHFIFATLAASSFVIIILALFTVFRLKRVKRRILWPVFIIVLGTPVFIMNWSTGDWMYAGPGLITTGNMVKLELLKLTFFGAAFSRESMISPWTVQAALPFGAIVFWIKYWTVGITRKVPKAGTVQTPSPDSEAEPDEPDDSRD